MTAPRTNAGHDQNRVPTLIGVSTSDGTTPVPVEVDPATGQLQVAGGGGGTQYAELTTTSPATGTLAEGRYKSSAPTLTDGQLYGLQLDANGKLLVSGTFSASAATDTAPATQNITVVDSGSSSATGANNQSIITGSPTAASAASFSVASLDTIRVQVTGTWTGTLTAEASIDGGTTWVALGLHQSAYTTSAFTANFVGGANVAGATNFRMRATATITGTATVKVVQSVNNQSVYVANAAPSGNIISVLNSSTATLTSGSVFTGVGEDVSNFAEIRVSVISNVASGGDGLSIQQSMDNTNWDITDVYTIAANTGKTYTVPRQARYYRIVYTNGGTNQTSFRLQTIFDRMPTAPSSNRAADAYTNETDLVQNQAFLMGYNGSTWDRVRTLGTGVLSASAVLTAGSAIIGKVGIDQTTPGTTNAVSANQGTAAALASGWPTLNGEASDTSGTFTNATQTTSVTANSLDGYGNVLVSINGTYGTATAVFEGSDDGGTTWYGISEADRTDSNVIESGYTSLTNTSRAWQISNPGWDSVRVRSTAVASGTVNVRISPSAAPTSAGASVSIGTALPTGANVIGSVNQGTSPWVTNDPGLPNTLGQSNMAGSTSVAIASDQGAIGTVGTTSAVVNVGQKTVATTATQISITSTVPTNGIIIQALSTNAASIFVGGSGVTTSTGFELVAGQAMSFSCNLNTLYIISVASTTDKICYNVE